MPSQEEVQEMKAKKKKEGLFGGMSGVQKVLLIIFGLSIFFLVWTFAFGGIDNFYQLIFFFSSFFGIAGLLYVFLTAASWFLAPDLFSPKKDFFNKIVNLAIELKPTNVRDLYFRGDIDKQKVRVGKIVGLLGIPYLIGTPKMHEKNIYDSKTKKLIARKGTPKYRYSEILKRDIPVFDKIKIGNDGDTLFIYEAGGLFFKRRHYLRCHKTLHGDLHGDVWVDDINPIPYGGWEYPYKQWQEEPAKIMVQNQLEIILATHDHQGDLISQGVDAAVYFNPAFRLMQKSQAEVVQ